MRLKSDLTLLFVAVIWGSSFAVQRVAAQYIGPFLFNGSRFLLGGLILLPLIKFKINFNRQTWLWAAVAGVFISGGSVLQQFGLQWTSAGNAGFITAMYVVIVPLILLIIWRQNTNWINWVAVVVAVIGMFLLSAQGKFELAPGDGVELIGSFFWAAHVVWVGKAMQRFEALPFAIGQYLVAGVINVVLGLILDWNTVPGLIPGWWTVAYIGVLSVAVGYTLQVKAQKTAPAVDAALILSLESVFAAIFGFLTLGETFQPIQMLGAGLIFGAVILTQFIPESPAPGAEKEKLEPIS